MLVKPKKPLIPKDTSPKRSRSQEKVNTLRKTTHSKKAKRSGP